jgi:arsenite methyltransferase
VIYEGNPVNPAQYIAAQLRKPTGFFGRIFITRLLNRRNIRMNSLTLETLHLQPDDTVLEIGFGGGFLIDKMSHQVTRGRITGADFSNDMVEFCTRRFGSLIASGRIDLHCANVESLPFPAGMFSKICTVNTIYFWPDPTAAVREIYRVLKENGTLVISYTPRAVMEKMKIALHGFALFEPADVESMMTMAGFKEVRHIRGQRPDGESILTIGKK